MRILISKFEAPASEARRVLVPTYRHGCQAQFIEKPVPVSTSDASINRLLSHLRQNLQAQYSLDELAEGAHMSRRTLTRSFQKATGMSIGEWLLAERLQHTQELLEASSQSIERIAELAGFGTARSLRQHFRNAFGVSPPAIGAGVFATQDDPKPQSHCLLAAKDGLGPVGLVGEEVVGHPVGPALAADHEPGTGRVVVIAVHHLEDIAG